MIFTRLAEDMNNPMSNDVDLQWQDEYMRKKDDLEQDDAFYQPPESVIENNDTEQTIMMASLDWDEIRKRGEEGLKLLTPEQHAVLEQRRQRALELDRAELKRLHKSLKEALGNEGYEKDPYERLHDQSTELFDFNNPMNDDAEFDSNEIAYPSNLGGGIGFMASREDGEQTFDRHKFLGDETPWEKDNNLIHDPHAPLPYSGQMYTVKAEGPSLDGEADTEVLDTIIDRKDNAPHTTYLMEEGDGDQGPGIGYLSSLPANNIMQ